MIVTYVYRIMFFQAKNTIPSKEMTWFSKLKVARKSSVVFPFVRIIGKSSVKYMLIYRSPYSNQWNIE